MFRKRERFERTDVPRESPYRNVIGVVVCVVVLAAVALTVSLVWNRVSLESRLGDTGISSSLDSVGSVAASADGYVASTDDREITLLLTTDNVDATGSTLTSVRLLSVNHTRGAAGYINLTTDVAVPTDSGHVTLSQLFSEQGADACVAPLASVTGIAFDHVIVATGDVVEEAVALAGSDPSSLVRSASDLLSTIRTDMDAAELVSLAGDLSAVGVANITAFDAPLTADMATDESGASVATGLQTVDATQLAITLGLLVPAA